VSKRIAKITICFGLLLLSAGILLAQIETPAPEPSLPTATIRPVELTCDPNVLLEEQQGLTVQLENFGDDSEANPGLALDNLFKVGAAYQELALRCGYIPADVAARPVGTDVERILTVLAELSADPISGQVLYNTEYGCAGCHEGENRVAPPTEGTYTRIEETRLNDPALEDYTPEQFIVESIVSPGQYVAPGYQNIMPHDFGERLTAQEFADLVIFLESQDQLLPADNPTLSEFTGELTADNLVAQHTFDGIAGDVVIIELSSDTFDPFLSILSPDNAELANNDDFGGTTNARIGPFLLPSDGVFMLQVDSYDRQSTGSYTLNVATYSGCGPAPIGIVSTTTQSVNLRAAPNTNSSLTGSVQNDECFSIIGRAANADWLQIYTLSGQTGWIAASFIQVAGDVASLPIAE
jgi:hypothetical protein